MRLIDADAIIEVMQKCAENPENKQALLCYRYTQRILEEAPTVEPFAPWHRVEEPPKEGTWCVIAKHSYLQPHNLFYDIAHYLHGTFSVYDSGVGDWFDGKPLYWMPIEPPKEE